MDAYKSIRKWEKITRPLHLTIGDVLKLPIGEPKFFLCLDRNVDEHVDYCIDLYTTKMLETDGVWPEKEIKASELLKNVTYFRFTRKGDDLKGDGFVSEDDGMDDLLEDRTADYPGWGSDFEFHIEYANGFWYPLEQGALQPRPPNGTGSVFDMQRVTTELIHWTRFPTLTRLGWRGPMIPLEKIDEIPIPIIKRTDKNDDDDEDDDDDDDEDVFIS